VELRPGEVLGPGRQGATIVVTPHVGSDLVEVLVTASEGLAIEGERSVKWTAKGGSSSHRYLTLATVGPGGRRLAIFATLKSADGKRQSAVASYQLHRDGHLNAPLEDLHPGSRIVAGPDSERILIIPARESRP
jgi:hypothetical protein